jgi:hypothetical protein
MGIKQMCFNNGFLHFELFVYLFALREEVFALSGVFLIKVEMSDVGQN